jgi:hypothetical protein
LPQKGIAGIKKEALKKKRVVKKALTPKKEASKKEDKGKASTENLSCNLLAMSNFVLYCKKTQCVM